MKTKYRYKLTINSVEYSAAPLIGDGSSIQGKQPPGQYYHRETLAGGIKFSGADYERIMARPLDEYIFFEVEKSEDYGTTWGSRFTGRFTLASASDIDEDEKKIVVDTEATDIYKAIEDGKDKTFNLPDLTPPLVQLNAVRQPLFQIYIEGSTFINNFLGTGVNWEQPLPSPVFTGVGNDLENIYKFQYISGHYFIPGDASTLSPDVSGTYDKDTRIRTDNAYEIKIIGSGPSLFYRIVDKNNSDAAVYESGTGSPLISVDPYSISGRATFTSLSSASQCRAYSPQFYARMLTNLETVGASPTFALPDPDIVADNNNYTRVLPIDITGLAINSALYQVLPTSFGRYAATAANHAWKYFVRPSNLGTEQYQPVSKSEWQAFSIWFVKDATIRSLQEDASQDIIIKDCYRLSDTIKAVITQLNPLLEHEETTAYSDFLYGSSNTIRGARKHPIITSKQHVIIGDYDQPATKLEVRLSSLTELLYIKYRCKAFIDGTKFRIEHEDFFERGLSYTTENVDTDFTLLAEGHTRLPWTFDTKKYVFEKADIPERLEFGWMDKTSQPFDGFPIDITSKYAQAGNVKDNKIGSFTSDFDYMISQPSDISKDGFWIGDCDQVSADIYSLPFVTLTVDGTVYKLQNGYSSFFYIHAQYYDTRLPAKKATINKVPVEVAAQRRKVQDITAPPTGVSNWMELQKTQIGNGLVSEYEESLTNGSLKIKLRHDTEDAE